MAPSASGNVCTAVWMRIRPAQESEWNRDQDSAFGSPFCGHHGQETCSHQDQEFHWHVSGPNFRDYHLMFDEHGDQLFAMTDEIAERVRKIGGTTLRSIGDIAKHQRIADNDAPFVDGWAARLRADNVREVIALTPLEQILLETDAPYLTPVPYRGRPNAPFYLPLVAEKVAEVKQLDVEAMLEQVYRNSMGLFFGAR